MDTVARWLDSLGLGQYAEFFAEHAIDEEVLPELDEDDLEKLGIKLGHRKKLLKAIAAARGPPGSTHGPLPRAPDPAPRGYAEHRQLTVMFCDLVGSRQR